MAEPASTVWITPDVQLGRNVKLGKSSGDNVEIKSGLKAGDVISLEDEEKKEAGAE